ncbi:hypothetical protein SDC9_211416 [bioreactor metagenome]|uniref:Uncharacterized protein n=1 Tax=bioreactor metagenome TaxID=1076179 RepID=A0A645JJ64_9ZZZZ
MGVNAHVAAGFQTPGQNLSGNTGYLSPAGDPVNGAVGEVVEPSPLDYQIGGIFPRNHGKHGLKTAVHGADIAAAQTDVLPYQFLRWEMVPPLGWIARLLHELAGGRVNFHDVVPVGRLSTADHQTSRSVASIPAKSR